MAPVATSGHINGATNGETNGINHGFESRKNDLSQEAYLIVQEKVPSMKAFGAVLELDIGLPEGAIFIDMRNDPCQILTSFDGEANCSVKIKPLYVKRFYEGAMDPRYGLFKDGVYFICSTMFPC
jgi:hypothetical protein